MNFLTAMAKWGVILLVIFFILAAMGNAAIGNEYRAEPGARYCTTLDGYVYRC